MKDCLFCKKQFSQDTLMVHAVHGNNIIYYCCRPCRAKRAAQYRKTKIGRQKIVKNGKASIQRHPERNKARIIFANAVKNGEVVKPKSCETCKQVKRIDGHHEDYSKPLQVMWLCRQCHADRHKYLKANNIPLK